MVISLNENESLEYVKLRKQLYSVLHVTDNTINSYVNFLNKLNSVFLIEDNGIFSNEFNNIFSNLKSTRLNINQIISNINKKI